MDDYEIKFYKTWDQLSQLVKQAKKNNKVYEREDTEFWKFLSDRIKEHRNEYEDVSLDVQFVICNFDKYLQDFRMNKYRQKKQNSF